MSVAATVATFSPSRTKSSPWPMILAPTGIPGTHFGLVADLDTGELALRHFDHGQHGIKRNELNEFAPLERECRLANLDRHIADHPRPRRQHDPAVAFGFGRRQCTFGGGELRFEV